MNENIEKKQNKINFSSIIALLGIMYFGGQNAYANGLSFCVRDNAKINTEYINKIDTKKRKEYLKKKVDFFNKLLKDLENKYPNVDLSIELNVLQLLKDVNILVNHNIGYSTDREIYGKGDYWATGNETVTSLSGDCEDFATLKKEILISFGVPDDKLLLHYSLLKSKNEKHLVLGYQTDDGRNLILDNYVQVIYEGRKSNDLQIIFSFDSEFIYVKGKKLRKANAFKKYKEYKDRINIQS